MVKKASSLELKSETVQYIKNLIEKEYGINVKNVEKIKNVYKIYDFNDRIYALKIIKYEFKHFNFIYRAMKYLQNNGFDNIPIFIKTINDKEYIDYNEEYIDESTNKNINEHALKIKYAYLNPWVMGRECNYNVMEDIDAATRQLADLHLKARGFITDDTMKPRNYVGKWIENFETRRKEILDFKRIIGKKNNKSQFDIEYEKLMNKQLQLCIDAIQGLKENNYIEYIKGYDSLKEFCHHDYANHNILISENDISLIDFDYCILDTHLHDLASLLIRVMKDGNWNINTAKHIINVYNEQINITPIELPLMAAFIEFPQAYWQLGIQCYWEKQRWGEEIFIKKLNKISTDSLLKESFVKELGRLGYEGRKQFLFNIC